MHIDFILQTVCFQEFDIVRRIISAYENQVVFM